MSLGLAYCDNQGIHLAVESAGLVERESPDSKPLDFGSECYGIVTGSLEIWRVVKHKMDGFRQQSVLATATEIARLINESKPGNDGEFCILAGYDSGQPVLYRVNRERNQHRADDPFWCDPREIQPVGKLAIVAARVATEIIRDAADARSALTAAITTRIQEVSDEVYARLPIHSRTIVNPAFSIPA